MRYNDPILMSEMISAYASPEFSPIGHGPNRFDSRKVRESNKYDLMHTAFVWHLPKSGFSLVVDGTGERTQRGWTPNQVVCKHFIPADTAYENAKKHRSISSQISSPNLRPATSTKSVSMSLWFPQQNFI